MCLCGEQFGYLRFVFFFSSRRRHTRSDRDWSSDVCSSDLEAPEGVALGLASGEAQPELGSLARSSEAEQEALGDRKSVV